jgi:outer membrane protein assembly factor BamB
MDNGSVVVTKEGYIVATLNFTNGQENGGIIVVDPSTREGKLVAEYRVQEKVSGAPAIDAAGNIHFGTESGNYYVVDKDCKLVAKKDLKEIVVADERYKESIPLTDPAKVYSSVVIGDDGKVFLQFTNNDSGKKREFGALVCLEVGGCTAVGDTPWPMIGQNRRHTNCEK